MPRKPIVVGLVGLLLAVAAYRVQAPGRSGAGAGATAMEAGSMESPGASWDVADWTAFETRVRRALEQRMDTLSMGETMAFLGRSFVGTPYVPHTLEVPGPEHVVVNFRGMDCVTLVENTLALARFVHLPEADKLLDDRGRGEATYEALLAEIRYRSGVPEGYASRLHYFSEWIADAEAKGLATDVTARLGGVPDPEPVDFMSTHPDAYRQLSDTSNLRAIRATEARLTREGRRYVPQDRVADVAPSIHDGDIIAATSTVPGLDVAHTGLALWVDGTLRLLHAPLVGDSVQISEEPLAERIRRIQGQDGIMVARPGEAR